MPLLDLASMDEVNILCHGHGPRQKQKTKRTKGQRDFEDLKVQCTILQIEIGKNWWRRLGLSSSKIQEYRQFDQAKNMGQVQSNYERWDIWDLTVPAIAFPRFTHLLNEIQDLIWVAAIEDFGPITIRIEPRDLNTPGKYRIRSSGIPPVLHVSHDPHNVASKYFSYSFGSVHGRYQYFNMQQDILQLVAFRRWLHDPAPTPNILQEIGFAENVTMLEYPELVRGESSWIQDIQEQIPPLENLKAFCYQDLEYYQLNQSPWLGRDVERRRRAWRDEVIRGVGDYWGQVVNPNRLIQGRPMSQSPQVFFCDSEGVVLNY